MPKLRARHRPPHRPKSKNPVVKRLDDLIPPGMTREELAFEAGYAVYTMQNWFKGQTRMPVDALVDVAQAIGYRVELVPMERKK